MAVLRKLSVTIQCMLGNALNTQNLVVKRQAQDISKERQETLQSDSLSVLLPLGDYKK